MISLVRGGAAAAVFALASGSLTSCLEQSTPAPAWALQCPNQTSSALTLVVGSRANSPKTHLPSEVQQLVRGAALQGQKVQVVRVDGVPSVALTATFATNSKNQQLRDRDLENFVSQTVQFADTLQPKQPEADVLGALVQAGQITPDNGTVVVMDSGVSTTGPLSYQNPDMFGADPDQVATFLANQHLMPQLQGRSVLFVGLGETADPQPQLVGDTHDQVSRLWHTIAKKAGASCDADLHTAVPRNSVQTSVAVTVVKPPPPPTFVDCGTTVLSDSSSVGFVVGKAQFRDPGAAKSTLDSLAKTLAGHTQKVTLIGTTSSEGSDEDNQRLSEQRAAAVKDVLVQLGVDAGRIATIGKGEHYEQRETDVDQKGNLIPDKAAHNRSVVVQLTCQKG
ncbi:OmpA family protein [Dactylosporangium sp. CA-139066]|uniref:OmpA family protein n=1 Tax=Dactylosporangium sp. CA-139066 TaxID=3239930 RepID=UPI003D8F56FF